MVSGSAEPFGREGLPLDQALMWARPIKGGQAREQASQRGLLDAAHRN